MSARLTKEAINQWLEDNSRETRLIGTYTNNYTKALFRGKCGHEWETTWLSARVSKTDKCKACGDRIVGRGKRCNRTNKDYENLLIYRDISPLENYKGARVKSLHRCEVCKHEFLARPDDIIRKKSGCPICGRIKRLLRYKGNRLRAVASATPLYLYIAEHRECIKIGVSVKPDNRIRDLNSHGFPCIKILEITSNYWDAVHMEDELMRTFKTYKYKGVKFDGYTELLDKEELPKVIEFINRRFNNSSP